MFPYSGLQRAFDFSIGRPRLRPTKRYRRISDRGCNRFRNAISQASEHHLKFFARYRLQTQSENLGKMRGKTRSGITRFHPAAEDALKRRGTRTCNAARNEQIEIAQVSRDIVREAVGSHPAA